MRIILAALVVMAAATAIDAGVSKAEADPYRWCAQYGGRNGGTNCYFMTLDQCRAAISGLGGFCTPNQFYTGPGSGYGNAKPKRRRAYY